VPFEEEMRSPIKSLNLRFVIGATVIWSDLISAASASANGNDPCKVLTAEKFSQIMGYMATIDKTASNQTSCFYQGPAHTGGQFMILTESASGPHADVMLKGHGSVPPGSGLMGGAYREVPNRIQGAAAPDSFTVTNTPSTYSLR
jgi:hypothetical protein